MAAEVEDEIPVVVECEDLRTLEPSQWEPKAYRNPRDRPGAWVVVAKHCSRAAEEEGRIPWEAVEEIPLRVLPVVAVVP